MLVPPILTAIAYVPNLLEVATGLISISITSGTTLFLSHVARECGRRAEVRLFTKWAGMPTTHWLSHKGKRVDEQTIARYHKFLETQIDGWIAPSPRDERENFEAAKVTYETATRWLREKTRDREMFDTVFRENVSYGYRRNLFGLKTIALILAFSCLAVNLGMLCFNYFWSSDNLETMAILATGLNLLFVVCWFSVVREQWVKDAAENYARALVATCDQMSGK